MPEFKFKIGDRVRLKSGIFKGCDGAVFQRLDTKYGRAGYQVELAKMCRTLAFEDDLEAVPMIEAVVVDWDDSVKPIGELNYEPSGRRLKLLHLSADLLATALHRDDFAQLRAGRVPFVETHGLPEDVKVVGCEFEAGTASVRLLLESKEFEIVHDGCAVPDLATTHMRYLYFSTALEPMAETDEEREALKVLDAMLDKRRYAANDPRRHYGPSPMAGIGKYIESMEKLQMSRYQQYVTGSPPMAEEIEKLKAEIRQSKGLGVAVMIPSNALGEPMGAKYVAEKVAQEMSDLTAGLCRRIDEACRKEGDRIEPPQPQNVDGSFTVSAAAFERILKECEGTYILDAS